MENLREVPPINELDELECSSDPEESSVTIADEQHVPSSPIKRVRVSIPHSLRSFCEVR